MTTIDYKEKYEQALERARQFSEKPYLEDSAGIVEYIFPELKESEDERIRKALLEMVHDTTGDSLWVDYNVHKEDVLAWLEKKPDTNCLLSWSETDEKMLQSLEGIVKDYWAKAEQEKNEIKIREASNVSYFLKTIQKSPLCWIKCSDGLPNRDGIYLVVTDGRHNDVYDMARYDSIEGWHKASEIIYWMPIPQLNNKSIIEQKPVWSEEDVAMLDSAIAFVEHSAFTTIGKGKNNVIAWLKSIRDKAKPQPQPKQEWSENEEDVEFIKDLMDYFGGGMPLRHSNKKIFYWLRRFIPSSKFEWTVNDEALLNSVVAFLKDIDNKRFIKEIENCIDWLKSLRPKSQWKPSDEQMGVIEAVINNRSFQRRHLDSLYEQLKKLKGE